MPVLTHLAGSVDVPVGSSLHPPPSPPPAEVTTFIPDPVVAPNPTAKAGHYLRYRTVCGWLMTAGWDAALRSGSARAIYGRQRA